MLANKLTFPSWKEKAVGAIVESQKEKLASIKYFGIVAELRK